MNMYSVEAYYSQGLYSGTIKRYYVCENFNEDTTFCNWDNKLGVRGISKTRANFFLNRGTAPLISTPFRSTASTIEHTTYIHVILYALIFTIGLLACNAHMLNITLFLCKI